MANAELERGTANRGTKARAASPTAGNPGTFLRTERIDGVTYARYRAQQGTWVSESLRQLGYDRQYSKDLAFGAYAGVVRTPDGALLATPDRIRPGQEYLIPISKEDQASRIRVDPLPRSRANGALGDIKPFVDALGPVAPLKREAALNIGEQKALPQWLLSRYSDMHPLKRNLKERVDADIRKGHGQRILPPISGSTEPIGDVVRRGFDWASGYGNEVQIYGPNGEEVEALKDAPRVEEAREFYKAKTEKRAEEGLPPEAVTDFTGKVSFASFGSNFGPKQIVQSGLSPTKQFVGGAVIHIFPADGDNIIVVVVDSKSIESLLRFTKVIPWAPDPVIFNRDEGPGKTQLHVYTWKETLPLRRPIKPFAQQGKVGLPNPSLR